MTATTTPVRLPIFARLNTGGMQTELPKGTTVAQALRTRGLSDWNVETMPLVTMGHDGMPLETDKVATVRRTPDGGSAVLGVGLSADYPVIQNEQALGVDALVDESGAQVLYAGAMKNGRQTYLSMRLPDSIRVGGTDLTDLYVTAITSHDGSLAATVMVTPVRLFCTNALPVSRLRAVSTYKVRHVGDAGMRVAEARAALNMTFAYAGQWQKAMEALVEAEMTDRQFDKIVADVFLPLADDAPAATVTRVTEGRETVRGLWAADPTHGTRYGAFNALTEWSEWVRPRDAFGDSAARSTLDGAGAAFRERAYRVLAGALTYRSGSSTTRSV